jgi:filamin
MTETWQEIQKRVFTNWVNRYLSQRSMEIQDFDNLRDGVKLINLLEILSHKSLGKYEQFPILFAHKIENVVLALKFLEKENVQLVNIGPEDIVNGNLKLIMGLIWTLIMKFQLILPPGASSTTETAKSHLIAWVHSKIPYHNITGFNTGSFS